MFKAAIQNRVFHDVVNQIQDAILDGRLKSGDALPPEREMKTMFNTSRGTLREALRVLEERGLVEIRLGMRGGAFVKHVNTDQATETLALLIHMQRVSLAHLSEFRRDLEGSVAALAAQRGSAEETDQLQSLIEEAGEYVENGIGNRENYLRLDRKFHLALAEMTHNPVFIFVLRSIHDNIHQYYDRFLNMSVQARRENQDNLNEIALAVGQRRVDDARILAQSHVLRFHRHMEAHQEEISS